MADIAILGFGVVGGGIADVIDENKEKIKQSAGESLNVKYILDLRDFPDSPYADRVIHSIDPILADPDVTVVCEAMGGTKPALDFSLRALSSGKNVITSNKELVAKHGDELLRCAAEHGVVYLYEAAVGGGIPVLRSMKTSLASEKIARVTGILNGTTNYILTKMEKEGGSFADALAEAQDLGYAESNPTADVDGLDAQRKIMILAAIASGKLLPESAVYAGTVRNISGADLAAAKKLGGTVKLLGRFENGECPTAFVSPFFVPQDNVLASVDDVYNGIRVECEITGDVMYYGRGAGRYPTAGAMVSDVCAAVSGAGRFEHPDSWERVSDGGSFFDLEYRFMIRFESLGAYESFSDAVDLAEYVTVDGGVACLTGCKVTKARIDSLASTLGGVVTAIPVL